MKKITYLFLIATLIVSCKHSTDQDLPNAVNESSIKKRNLSTQEKKHFDLLEIDFLKQKFFGVTTSEGKQGNLFPIKTTGLSTEPIKLAAEAFLGGLTKEQLAKTCFEIEDEEWRRWCNVSNGGYTRQGISIKEMSEQQRTLAFGLMSKSLSLKGLQLSKNIMKTDHTLHELNDNDPTFDEELYFFTVMGTPSMTEPWGWQIDGHHLVINYFILDDQIVMTPTFMGGEAVISTTGKYKGNSIFQDEQNIGLRFMQSLDSIQQSKATLSPFKRRNDIQAEAFADNDKVDYQGLPVSEMTVNQKTELLNLVSLYINNMKEGHANERMEEITEHIDKTYFAWIGQTDENAVFYYRIHSPVILLEFDHQLPIWAKPKEEEKQKRPTRNHVHTVVRTPNGNDYGKDLLRQHLEKYH